MEPGNFSVSLTVKDPEASRAFYTKLAFNPGWTHKQEQLESFEDVRVLRRRLKQQGIELQTEALTPSLREGGRGRKAGSPAAVQPPRTPQSPH